ncbi:MAG: redoxin domain-containing protein [Anaerolineales bacterium]|nr:redoxin domain-containing protein [Anaerolineales bacterium]
MAERSLPTISGDVPEAGIRWGRLIVWVAVIGLFGGLGWKMWQNNLDPVSSGAAPDFTLNTFDGQTLLLSELRGKVVVINFWASWCVPCRDEAPILEAAWREYRERDVVFIGVDYLDTETEARAYLAEFDITYPNGPDLRTLISTSYRIKGIPETFFVDAAGQMRDVFIGPINDTELRRRVEGLLSGDL